MSAVTGAERHGRKHVDIMQVQLEGGKQQKRDYQLKLQRKMHAIERMQQEYQELEDELTPFIETMNSGNSDSSLDIDQ